jgi:hypothetical protein
VFTRGTVGVVREVPAEPTRREIRKTIFSWTQTRFPLHIRSRRELTINETPIITVIGTRSGLSGQQGRRISSGRSSHLTL